MSGTKQHLKEELIILKNIVIIVTLDFYNIFLMGAF